MGAVWKNTCTKKHGLYTCSSKLAMPVSKATSPLTIRCLASLGDADISQVSAVNDPSSPAAGGAATSAAYLDWVEHEAKVVNPTRPILGVPLTSAATNIFTGNNHLYWLVVIVFARKIFIFSDDLSL